MRRRCVPVLHLVALASPGVRRNLSSWLSGSGCVGLHTNLNLLGGWFNSPQLSVSMASTSGRPRSPNASKALWSRSNLATASAWMVSGLGHSLADLLARCNASKTTALGLLKSGQVRLGHEEIRPTTQSVRNEETLRDRSGRPDIDSQEGAWPQETMKQNWSCQ